MEKQKNQHIRWIAAGVIITAVIGWSAYNTLSATAPAQETASTKVKKGDMVLTVDGSGTLEIKSLPVGFESAGVIEWIMPSGSQVKTGDVIGMLESKDASLSQLESSLVMASLTSPAEIARMDLEKLLEEDERDLALEMYQNTVDGPDIRYYAEQVSITEAAYWEAVASVTRARKITPGLKVAVEKALASWEQALEDLEWAINYTPRETDVLLTSAMLSQSESALQDIDVATAVIQGTFDPNEISFSTSLTDAWYNLENANMLLERTMIIAPFDGTLSSFKVNIGEQVEAYQSVVTLLDTSKTTVQFSLEEADLRDLDLGDPISVTLSAFPTTSLDGKVTSIGSRVEPNGSVLVEGEVAIPEGIMVFSGMTVDVVVETRRTNDTLILNSSAVFHGEDGTSFVWRLNPLGGEEKIEVLTGISDLTNIEILEGLNAGDLIRLSQPGD